MKTYKIIAGDLEVTGYQPEYIAGEDKLVQDILECLVVDQQPRGYGAGLGSIIGTVGKYIPAKIAFRVLSALEYYQSLQKYQKDLEPEETVKSIYSVQPSQINKTDYGVSVSIATKESSEKKTITLFGRPNLKA